MKKDWEKKERLRKLKKIKITLEGSSVRLPSIKRGYKPQTRILRNELGELVTKEESVVEELKKHFECLLNKTPPTPLNEEIDM